MEYRIISQTYKDQLTITIQSYLDKGWIPLGAPFISPTSPHFPWYQAIIKEFKDTDLDKPHHKGVYSD